MPSKQKYIFLFCILIVAIFFRFYHLTTTPPGLYQDEAMDGNNAVYAAHTGDFKVFYTEDNGREGLYINMLALAYRYNLLPEAAPWSVRVPAAIAGTLTVLGIFFLVEELFLQENPETRDMDTDSFSRFFADYRSAIALLSAFFLAVSFWHINFSRIGFRAILSPLFLVWSIWLILKMIREKKNSPALTYAILAGLFYGLGFYTYIAYRITPFILLAFVPVFKGFRDFWKRAYTFVAATVATTLPLAIYFIFHPADFFGRASEISISNSRSPITDLLRNMLRTILMFNWHGDYNWRQNISGAPELFWPIGIFFLIGIFFCVRLLVKRHRNEASTKFPALLLFSWLILGALPEIFSDEGIPHALRSLLMIIPVMIFSAIGAWWTYLWLRSVINKKFAIAIGWFFLAIILVAGYVSYFILWAKNPNVPGAFSANDVAIGDAINALPSSTQKYVVVPPGSVADYGFPMAIEPVLFVTDSFVPDATGQRYVKNIHYLLLDQLNQIPTGTPSDTIFDVD